MVWTISALIQPSGAVRKFSSSSRPQQGRSMSVTRPSPLASIPANRSGSQQAQRNSPSSGYDAAPRRRKSWRRW